jgi:SAM-dependent methyltransferase
LPFCPSQFDRVVFNASLHYSVVLESTLCEAKRVLAEGGEIFALDSPFYSKESDGTAMIDGREAEFAVKFGFKREVVNTGFLTRARLEHAAAAAGLKFRIWMNDERWDKRIGRAWTQRRTGREPARFPLIVFGI